MKKLFTLLALIFCLQGKAQFTQIFSFSNQISSHANIYGDLFFDGTYLYGMTENGGSIGCGDIFKIKPDGTGYDTLHNFKSATGCFPYGSLIFDGTFLYGLTYQGGANNLGVIFKIMPNGTGYSVLYDFAGTPDGANPKGTLTYDGTYLYGTTTAGGINTSCSNTGCGTIFKIKPDGTSYTKLHDMLFSPGGPGPQAALLYDGTYLYGMNTYGGGSGYGFIFKIMPNGTGYIDIYDFPGATGINPYGSLISNGIYLYGMTSGGNNPNSSTIFKITKNGGNMTVLHSFSGTNNDGYNPWGSLFYDGTYLYGMTKEGAAGVLGGIFKILPSGSGYNQLYSFNGVNSGAGPYGSLISDGTFLYGMTNGNNAVGNIFKYKIGICATATYTLMPDVVPHTWDAYPSYSSYVTSARWYWGDGTSTTGLYPSHTYSVAGRYNICVAAYSSCGDSAIYCQNDTVYRLGNNNNTLSSMININVVSGGVPTYQKLLADSVTEFDAIGICHYAKQQTGTQQTMSNCVSTQLHFPGGLNAWYAKGDSLYNGKTYKKITYSNSFQGLMREDTLAKKVYFIQYCNTNEELLYDFSLAQGDTISYHFQYSNYLITSGVFTVDSIRMQHDYKSYYNKHFYLKNHTTPGNYTLEMIEGVGNVSHPLFLYYWFQSDQFGTFPSCSSANFDEALSCKWNNGIKVYYDSCLYSESRLHGFSSISDSCSYCWGATGGITKYGDMENVIISPNPSTGNFVIETNTTTKQTLQIYDINGRIVLTQTINNKATIDASSLPDGVYNISILNNESIVNKRLVIAH